MSHKTMIDGVAYEISGGKTLIGGTAYSIKNGKTLVGGTAYEVGFAEAEMVTVSIGRAHIQGQSSHGWVIINGQKYYGEIVIYEEVNVPIGTKIKLYAECNGLEGTVKVNDSQVHNFANGNTYEYTVIGNAIVTINNIKLSETMYAASFAITEQ